VCHAAADEDLDFGAFEKTKPLAGKSLFLMHLDAIGTRQTGQPGAVAP
jgi:hypothetical protein